MSYHGVTPQPTQPPTDAADGDGGDGDEPALEAQAPAAAAAAATENLDDLDGDDGEEEAIASDEKITLRVRLEAEERTTVAEQRAAADVAAPAASLPLGGSAESSDGWKTSSDEENDSNSNSIGAGDDNHAGNDSSGNREEAAAAIASLLPPPRAVLYWWDGGDASTAAGEPQYDLAQEATRWLILAVEAAHLSQLIKQAGRRLMACFSFTVNLGYLGCWDQLLIPELKATLVALGGNAKEINAASNLAATLTTANVMACARYNLELFPAGADTPRNSIRQDTLMPSLAAAASTDYNRDWKAQPEHIYIHMLLLVATALNPLFGAALKTLASDLDGIELHDAPIKSFTRMLNKLMAADDHRYVEQKPRPAMNIDIVRLLASAATPADVLELVALVAARFVGLSHLKCLPELAATNPAAADARYHMLPVMVTVVFAPEGLTVDDLLADPTVRAAWANVRANRPSDEVSSEQWQLHHDTAVELLKTKCDPNEPVQMHCEVQVVTTAMAGVRHKMHEVYKVVRANDESQLHADVATPKVEAEGVDWDDVEEDDLYLAAESGRITTVKRLLQMSGGSAGGSGGMVDVNWQGEDSTVLYQAATKNHLPVVLVLLEHNADPNQARTDDGTTPLVIAAEKGHVDVATALLEHNADPNQATTDDGQTPLYVAAWAGHVDVVTALLAAGASPSPVDLNDGQTAISIAAQEGHLDIIKLLVDAGGVTGTALTTNGATDLWLACYKGHADVVRYLVAQPTVGINQARLDAKNGAENSDADADANADELLHPGTTPLEVAVLEGHNAIADLLKQHGAV